MCFTKKVVGHELVPELLQAGVRFGAAPKTVGTMLFK